MDQVFVPAGTIIKINGIPFQLEGAAEICGSSDRDLQFALGQSLAAGASPGHRTNAIEELAERYGTGDVGPVYAYQAVFDKANLRNCASQALDALQGLNVEQAEQVLAVLAAAVRVAAVVQSAA